jgi:hypothetical protein
VEEGAKIPAVGLFARGEKLVALCVFPKYRNIKVLGA